MAKSEATTSRAPRGTKQVSRAFFAALEDIPEVSRAAVAKAAQAMIREEIKSQREKAKARAASAKQKARKPTSRRTIAPAPAPAPKATRRAAPQKARKPATNKSEAASDSVPMPAEPPAPARQPKRRTPKAALVDPAA